MEIWPKTLNTLSSKPLRFPTAARSHRQWSEPHESSVQGLGIRVWVSVDDFLADSFHEGLGFSGIQVFSDSRACSGEAKNILQELFRRRVRFRESYTPCIKKKPRYNYDYE